MQNPVSITCKFVAFMWLFDVSVCVRDSMAALIIKLKSLKRIQFACDWWTCKWAPKHHLYHCWQGHNHLSMHTKLNIQHSVRIWSVLRCNHFLERRIQINLHAKRNAKEWRKTKTAFEIQVGWWNWVAICPRNVRHYATNCMLAAVFLVHSKSQLRFQLK